MSVAEAAAAAAIGPLDPDLVREAAGRLELHGRMELVAGSPDLLLDAAHNPDGAAALAEALPEAAGERPVVGFLAILADKDADGICRAVAPRVEALVCTEIPAERLAHAGRPGTRSVAAEELARVAAEAGVESVEAIPDPDRGAERLLALAVER